MWPTDFFILGLANSYGRQKAEDVVKQLIQAAGLPARTLYGKDEALKICETMIESQEVYFQTMGSCLKVRIYTGGTG